MSNKKARLGGGLNAKAVKQAQGDWLAPTSALAAVPDPEPEPQPTPATRPGPPPGRPNASPAAVTGEWAKLSAPSTQRGTSQGVHQIHVPVPASTHELLLARDHELIKSGERHPVSRHLLLTRAIDMLAENPERYTPLDAGEEQKIISGRIDAEHQRSLAMLRHSKDGKHATAPLLAAVITEILH